MKRIAAVKRVSLICSLCVGLVCTVPFSAESADFSVTSPGFFYSINGANPNPVLTVQRGTTYTFAISTASNHPFEILAPGVTSNNIFSGTITWTVPLVASNYNYKCSVHGFGNQIMTVAAPPPPPPTIQILSLDVSSNLTLLSTGTNMWSVIPEFNTNLMFTNWYGLTVQTNFFTNGTNETICGRPPGSPIFIRIRSQPQ